MNRSVSALLFGGLALVLALATLWVAGPASAATGGGNQIVVRSQDVNNGQVVVDSFNAPSAGWLLIQRASNSGPGAVIGFAPVHAGLNTGVRITVRTDDNFSRRGLSENSNNSAVTSTLFASFASDPNASNALATPPAGVEQRATLTVAFGSAAPAPAVAGGNTAPTTGGVSTSGQTAGVATTSNRIVARGQDITGNTVVIDSVNATQDGWLLIRSGVSGRLGPVIGWAPVHAGLNQGVSVNIQLSRKQSTVNSNGSVSLNRDYITPQLWAELVADPNAVNPFATPSTDVQDSPGYAMVPFSSTAPTSASGAVAGQVPATGGQTSSQTSQGAQGSPAALKANQIQARPQDILGNQVVFDSVTAAQDGWLLVHTDAGGRPGPVIGWAPVHAGLNQGVRVDIQLSRKRANLDSAGNVNSSRDYITSALWATLNPDSAALTPFATPNSAVQGSGVIAVPFSSTAAGGVGFGASSK